MYEDLAIRNSLEQSKNLSDWIAGRLDGLGMPRFSDNKRLQLAMACLHLAFEHAQGIIPLVDNGLFGSALALKRPMFEAIIRGVWLKYHATDEEVDKAATGKFPTSSKMAGNSPPLEALKENWWNRLCDYTHGGSEQILARLDNTGLSADYRSDEVVLALHWSNHIQLYSGVEMALAACDESLAKAFLDRMQVVDSRDLRHR